MDSNKITVAYFLSKYDWQYAYISITSLLENTKNRLEVILLHSNNISSEILEKFQYFENIYNAKIVFLETEYSISPRLELLNKFDFGERILFINSATIITKDLSELFNIDMQNKSIAACKNLNSEGFNTAITLINCKKCFQNNTIEKAKMFNKINNENELLNKLFENDWTPVGFKYCFMENPTNGIKKEIYRSKDYKCAKKSPAIVLFTGQYPRETTCHSNYKELWWQYAAKAPFNIEKIQSYKLSTTSAQNSFKYTWLLKRIFPYIKPYIPRIAIGFMIAIPLGLLDGVTAFALKPYMDYVIGGKSFEFHSLTITSLQMAFLLPIGVVLFAGTQGVLRYLNDYISAWTSQKITNDVKFDLFHKLINMHPQFFDDNSSGIIISRYMGDPAAASTGIVDQIKTITTSLFGALGLIAVMLYSSCRLAIIGVLVLCIAFIPVALIRKRIKEASNRNMVIGSNITTNINETYSGNKVMAAYGLQDRQESYFKEQVIKSFNINMSLTKRAAWMSPLMYLIASFGIATVLGYGTYLINTGVMTAGSFASFVTSLLLLYKPVKTLGGTLTGIQNIFVAMGRVFELFDLETNIREKEKSLELKNLNNGIEFSNIEFEYKLDTPVLKNINLYVPKNETLAIVGNSGGGKSTLVNLIPRFYDIKSGAIKIDGIDIRDFSLNSLRKNISMVFQDNFLYSGTIKENIMMGNPDASYDELTAAIKSAHLEDMIKDLPDGLDTMLGERGLTLSGGQRQRVAIARAMLRNAPIVILDEATSALDNESEAIVQKAMDNLVQNRTVFIIAHRLSTIKNANRIAVINEGELVELGTHESLMNVENGHYKALYEMQFKKQEAALS